MYDTKPKKELNIAYQPAYLSLSLIVDGEIDSQNLKMSGYDMKWLKGELKKFSIENVKEVLYAEWNTNDGLLVQKY